MHSYYGEVGAVLLFLQLLLLSYTVKVFKIAFIGHFQSAFSTLANLNCATHVNKLLVVRTGLQLIFVW